MRYPEHQKAETRQRIVHSAASALRSEGLDGISVPGLMKRAGLTHGGFYSHFKNREHLVAEAVLAAAHETSKRVFQGAESLDALKARYLSREHALHPEGGCVIAALGTEGRRQSEIVRHAFSVAASGLVKLVDQASPQGQDGDTPSDEALRTTSLMLGAVILARLVEDETLAARVLEVCRR